MDELIKEVTKRTGLPEDKARAAAEAVISFLKTKLPEPAAGMVSQYLGGQVPTADMAGKATNLVEGFLKKS
jgi:uncharacterized protein (DUF2267 family)